MLHPLKHIKSSTFCSRNEEKKYYYITLQNCSRFKYFYEICMFIVFVHMVYSMLFLCMCMRGCGWGVCVCLIFFFFLQDLYMDRLTPFDLQMLWDMDITVS